MKDDAAKARRAAVKFKAANDRSPVVSGTALHVGGEGPEYVTGAHYTLADGTRIVLSSVACQLLPEGYPRWQL